MKIYTPVKGATGVWCSVYFKNGVGETNKPHLIKWFKDHGYKVEDAESAVIEKIEETDEIETIADESVKVDFDSMSVDELREWMKANGYGSQIKNIKNKERLIGMIKEAISEITE